MNCLCIPDDKKEEEEEEEEEEGITYDKASKEEWVFKVLWMEVQSRVQFCDELDVLLLFFCSSAPPVASASFNVGLLLSTRVVADRERVGNTGTRKCQWKNVFLVF